jgi:hypothetical protein
MGPQGISLALSIVGGIVLLSAGYKTGGSGQKIYQLIKLKLA